MRKVIGIINERHAQTRCRTNEWPLTVLAGVEYGWGWREVVNAWMAG